MKKIWPRVRDAFKRLRYTEPALLRTYYAQAVLLLASVGLAVPGYVDRWVGVLIAVAAIAAPYYQGRKTRADVWSPKTVEDLAQIAALFPHLTARARELLGDGVPAQDVIRYLEQESLDADPPGQHATDQPR